MNKDQAQRVLSIVQKVGIFKEFTLMEAERLLRLCHYQTYAPDQRVYQAGEASTEMLILLQGRLKVVGEGGTTLGEIAPGTTTGEMGVLAGRPRSATVIATEPSTGFVIRKAEFDALLRSEYGICEKVYRNMLNLLCDRLKDANMHIEDYAEHAGEGDAASGGEKA